MSSTGPVGIPDRLRLLGEQTQERVGSVEHVGAAISVGERLPEEVVPSQGFEG